MRAADITPDLLPALRRADRLRGLSDSDVVQLWYRAPDADDWTLTERQDHIRQRIDFAKAQFLARRKYMEIAEDLVQEFRISIATARNDIRAAMHIFGDLDKVPKEAHRQRAIEMALETFRMAETAKDPDGMAKATKNYIAATGLERDDADAPDMEKLMKERVYVEVMDARLRDMLMQFVTQSGGAVDMTKIFEAIHGQAVDVEAEEIPAGSQ